MARVEHGEATLGLLASALEERIRAELRDRLMKKAKEDIDAAINAATADLKVYVQKHYAPMYLSTAVEFVLTDKRNERK